MAQEIASAHKSYEYTGNSFSSIKTINTQEIASAHKSYEYTGNSFSSIKTINTTPSFYGAEAISCVLPALIELKPFPVYSQFLWS
jgi:glycine betaine/choline ABC-type transport system substrate-binding protein